MVTVGIFSFKENSHGRAGNRTRDLMISSQRLWPLDHEAGQGRENVETTLILENLSRQQTIKMWKCCDLRWRKTADWVSGWLQKKRAWIKNEVHRILTQHLDKRKICAKLVPKNLSVEQKANRLGICQDLLGRLEIEPDFLDNVITGVESWVFD